MRETAKIGVFDSGFGGLSILKEIVKALPKYDYVYLGDTARTPYGNRSQKEIYKFTKQGVEFLFKRGAKMVILACNSASAEALRKLQHEYKEKKKVLGVIFPAAEEAVRLTKNKKIAVIGTKATIASGAFKREINKLDSKIKVFAMATPLLAPIVEAGGDKSARTKKIITKYLKKALSENPDTLILGCTHYGILENEIKRQTKGVEIISEGKVVALKLKKYLLRHKEIEIKLAKGKKREFFTTDSNGKFDRLGSRFFGKTIRSEKVKIQNIPVARDIFAKRL